MIQSETQFASVGKDRVAYQVMGEGEHDILLTSGFWSHVDISWEDPGVVRFWQRLASFSRLIRFDRRGTGLSDRPSDDNASVVEHWLQDCTAVLDAVGASTPFIIASTTLDAGALVLQFVDRHPARCAGLVFFNTTACWAAKPGYPQGLSPEAVQRSREFLLNGWGRPEFAASYAPSQASDKVFLRWYAKLQRSMASPRAVVENIDATLEHLDSRSVLPRIRVPALVLARSRFQFVPIAQSRYMAENIPGARFVELPGADGSHAWETPELLLDLIEEFVTGQRHTGDAERAFTTVLFTDIVSSTERAAVLGNATWRRLLDRHDQLIQEQVTLYQGRFVESSGDGTLSTFDNPRRAIDCAIALQEMLRAHGIDIRAGLHTGEVELRDNGRVGGMSVHIGARVLGKAKIGEVLASRTIYDVMIGSQYRFEDRGLYDLKGVPGQWPLYSVEAPKKN